MAGDLSADVAIENIDRVHRIGTNTTTPIAIIIKLATYSTRQKFYKSRIHAKFKGYMGVFIDEDLTRYRSNLLFRARSLVKSKCIMGAWISDGTILIKDNNSIIHRIMTENDLSPYHPRQIHQ